MNISDLMFFSMPITVLLFTMLCKSYKFYKGGK